MQNNSTPNVRRHAAKLLERILHESAFTNRLLDATFKQGSWDSRDKRLLSELLYGVLRHLYSLDHIIDTISKKGIRSVDKKILFPLRIALYEIIHLSKIPERASIFEAVKNVKKYRGQQGANFTNALLRRFLDQKNSFSPKNSNQASDLSIVYSHPLWLVERYIEELGVEHAKQRMTSNNQPSALTLRTHTPHISRNDLLSRLHDFGIQANPTSFSPEGILLESPLPCSLHQLFAEFPQHFFIQDEAAQILAHWLDPQAEDILLDACAAPGGKTTHIASLAPDATVVAHDIYEHKLKLITENANRLNINNIKISKQDATQPLKEQFHKILVDAPCSGLGILRKHPEIRHHRTQEQIIALQTKQHQLLSNLSQSLYPGGVIVYSVCTDTPEEGEQVARTFLQQHPHFELVKDHDQNKPWTQFIQPSGFLVTRPESHQIDGFFAAKFRKKLS